MWTKEGGRREGRLKYMSEWDQFQIEHTAAGTSHRPLTIGSGLSGGEPAKEIIPLNNKLTTHISFVTLYVRYIQNVSYVQSDKLFIRTSH